MRCKVCGREYKCISASHLRSHGLTMAEYKKKYNVTKTVDEEVVRRARISHGNIRVVSCPVCGTEGKDIIRHINACVRHNPSGRHAKFLVRLNATIAWYTTMNLYVGEIVEAVRGSRPEFELVPYSYVSVRLRETLSSGWSRDVLSYRRKGEKNPAKSLKVRRRISETVKGRWESGSYKDRINGMLGKVGALHHGYKKEKRSPLFLAEHDYVNFLANFQDITRCTRCGLTKEEGKINIHHIDENHSNFLVSNLRPLCVPCHGAFHFEIRKRPFIIVSKEFSFAAAHHLPDYEGNCRFPHGHEWRVAVAVRGRVDPDSGMVLDFKELKEIVNSTVIDLLDHDDVNRYLPNPTAENIAVWIWERLMFDGLLKGIYSITLWESADSYLTLDVPGMLSVFSTNIEKYLDKDEESKTK